MSAPGNLEAMARAVAEKVCRRKAAPGEDVAAWVEAHWYIAAADLEAGLIDEDGIPNANYTPERARAAVRDWLGRHAPRGEARDSSVVPEPDGTADRANDLNGA